MVSRVIPVDVFDLVIFGGTGDLARRKILPGLYRRFLSGQMVTESRIIGAARADLTEDAFHEQVRAAIAEFVPKALRIFKKHLQEMLRPYYEVAPGNTDRLLTTVNELLAMSDTFVLDSELKAAKDTVETMKGQLERRKAFEDELKVIEALRKRTDITAKDFVTCEYRIVTYVGLLFHHAASPFAFVWRKSSFSRRNFVRNGSEKLSVNKLGRVFCRLMATIASEGAIPGRMVLK